MSKDQLRSASKALAALLRRRGTSPAVGSGLRRSIQALDKALAAPDDQQLPRAIRQALAELRGCLVLIHASDRPADHEQLEGTAKALSLVAPLEADLPAEAAAEPESAATPSVFQTVVRATPAEKPPALPLRREPRTRRSLPISGTADAVKAQLAGLAASFDSLHAVATGLSHRLADLDTAREGVASRLRATTWSGVSQAPTIRTLSREAKDTDVRLAAAVALVELHQTDGAERSLIVLERSMQRNRATAVSARTVMHWLDDDAFFECARTVFTKTGCDAVRALLLPVLVERGQLGADALVPLVEHAETAVVVAAARALALVGESGHATSLMFVAGRTHEPARLGALLLAAATLGATDALVPIRSHVRAREPLSRAMLDALAVAGCPSDARALTELAADESFDGDVDTSSVLLAAANLGDPATLAALPRFADRVPPDVLHEARRRIAGTAELDVSRAKVRLFRGRPWSVAQLIGSLGDPDETVSAQRLLALELRARTGLVPPSLVPSLASTSTRGAVANCWMDHYAKGARCLAAGEWCFQGKPLPSEAHA